MFSIRDVSSCFNSSFFRCRAKIWWQDVETRQWLDMAWNHWKSWLLQTFPDWRLLKCQLKLLSSIFWHFLPLKSTAAPKARCLICLCSHRLREIVPGTAPWNVFFHGKGCRCWEKRMQSVSFVYVVTRISGYFWCIYKKKYTYSIGFVISTSRSSILLPRNSAPAWNLQPLPDLGCLSGSMLTRGDIAEKCWKKKGLPLTNQHMEVIRIYLVLNTDVYIYIYVHIYMIYAKWPPFGCVWQGDVLFWWCFCMAIRLC